MVQVDTERRSGRFETFNTSEDFDVPASHATVRTKKVAAIRKALADGTYETPEKVDLTVHRLLRVLRPDA